MSLKLFRHTGFSSILAPGESRLATHPGWLVLGVSAWVGLACNINLWRVLLTDGWGLALWQALATGLAVGGACGAVLSLLNWRRTLKVAATLVLLAAALAAGDLWTHSLSIDATLLERGWAMLRPAWGSLLQWPSALLVAALALPPVLWLWNAQIRRMTGPQQLSANTVGIALGLATATLGALALAYLR